LDLGLDAIKAPVWTCGETMSGPGLLIANFGCGCWCRWCRCCGSPRSWLAWWRRFKAPCMTVLSHAAGNDRVGVV